MSLALKSCEVSKFDRTKTAQGALHAMAQAVLIARGRKPSQQYDFQRLPCASALAASSECPSEAAQRLLYWYLQERHKQRRKIAASRRMDELSSSDSEEALGGGAAAAGSSAESSSSDTSDEDEDEDSETEAVALHGSSRAARAKTSRLSLSSSAATAADAGKARIRQLLGAPARGSSRAAKGRWSEVYEATSRESVTTAPPPSLTRPFSTALDSSHRRALEDLHAAVVRHAQASAGRPKGLADV